MVKLGTVRACNTALFKSKPLVVVVSGGTAGIGESSVRALAASHGASGQGLRLYITGRKETVAQKIIADCLKVCPKGNFRFVKANDLSLLKDVDQVCAQIIEAERKEDGTPRVDLLIMCQGVVSFNREDTKEGLDKLMSLLYYSRMRFITQLLPLLISSPTPGHVVSVFGPHRNAKIFADDLSLRDPKHYGFMNMGSHVAYMTTFFFERIAAQYSGKISLSHYFPGLVITAAFYENDLQWWFNWPTRALLPLVKPFTVPVPESGERVIFHFSSRFPAKGQTVEKETGVEVATASDGVVGGGTYRTNWNGETFEMPKSYDKLRADGMSEKIWEHTMKAFREIEAGRVFVD